MVLLDQTIPRVRTKARIAAVLIGWDASRQRGRRCAELKDLRARRLDVHATRVRS